MSKSKLPPELAEKYELVNWRGGHRQNFGPVIGDVDLTTLTEAGCEKLILRGFTKIRRKLVVPKKPTEKGTKSGK